MKPFEFTSKIIFKGAFWAKAVEQGNISQKGNELDNEVWDIPIFVFPSALFYRDVDLSADLGGLGMAALVAQNAPELGRWQFKPKGSETWEDLVTAQSELPVPPGMWTEHDYRGTIWMNRYMAKLACEYHDESLSLQSHAIYWQEVRRTIFLQNF